MAEQPERGRSGDKERYGYESLSWAVRTRYPAALAEGEEEEGVTTVETNLVTTPVSVMDRNGTWQNISKTLCERTF